MDSVGIMFLPYREFNAPHALLEGWLPRAYLGC